MFAIDFRNTTVSETEFVDLKKITSSHILFWVRGNTDLSQAIFKGREAKDFDMTRGWNDDLTNEEVEVILNKQNKT